MGTSEKKLVISRCPVTSCLSQIGSTPSLGYLSTFHCCVEISVAAYITERCGQLTEVGLEVKTQGPGSGEGCPELHLVVAEVGHICIFLSIP